MNRSSRREFLQTAAGFVGASMFIPSIISLKEKNRLAFSTLGCPDWSLQQIMDFAAKHGYTGIEVRGLNRQMDLVKCPEFNSDQSIKNTLSLLKQRGLNFVNLGSSANMHIADAAERTKNLDEGKRFIELAGKLNCPFIRVFPNNLPKEGDKKATMDLIIKGLQEMGDFAKGTGVKVLMETHGDLVHTNDLVTVMEATASKQVGLVWDITNMWVITKESPTEVYPRLKKYIYHAHIKNAKLVNGEPHYVFLREGDVPIFEAIDLLVKDNYKGYYSFEWEKLWHPEIGEPEVAFADFPEAIIPHLK